jgi:hypothetical protein
MRETELQNHLDQGWEVPASNFAGAGCDRNYYVVSWQNDALAEAAGELSTQLGFKRVLIVVPNYQGGRDAVNGFRRSNHSRLSNVSH